jgi:hypothetical protein
MENQMDKSRCIICGVPLEREGICSKCEYQRGLMFVENWYPNESNNSHLRNLAGYAECPCPICSGNPSDDQIFKYLFETQEDYYETW